MKSILLNGEISVNCFVIESNSMCYIIDPGYEKECVLDFVNKNSYQVLGILLTHGHIDHIGAIDAFKVPVYLSKKEYDVFLENYREGFKYYGKEQPYNLEDITFEFLEHNDRLKLADNFVQVIETPGHTCGSLCYKYKDELYTGDTLFKGTVGKWNYRTGDIAELRNSVIGLIDNLSDDVRIFPAHGEPTSIGFEKATNPYYIKWKMEE